MDPASQLCDGLCFLRGLALLLAVAVILAARRSAAPPIAQMTRVLGFDGALPSKHYVGYVTVDVRHGRNLFYYLVELERDPSKDPSCSGSTAALGAQASGCILRHNRIQHLVISRIWIPSGMRLLSFVSRAHGSRLWIYLWFSGRTMLRIF